MQTKSRWLIEVPSVRQEWTHLYYAQSTSLKVQSSAVIPLLILCFSTKYLFIDCETKRQIIRLTSVRTSCHIFARCYLCARRVYLESIPKQSSTDKRREMATLQNIGVHITRQQDRRYWSTRTRLLPFLRLVLTRVFVSTKLSDAVTQLTSRFISLTGCEFVRLSSVRDNKELVGKNSSLDYKKKKN